MRDKTHNEQIERWADYVRETPKEVWKPKFNEFIDAQFDMADKFRTKLKQSERGLEILREIIMARKAKEVKKDGAV